jgi:hypothetical protein
MWNKIIRSNNKAIIRKLLFVVVAVVVEVPTMIANILPYESSDEEEDDQLILTASMTTAIVAVAHLQENAGENFDHMDWRSNPRRAKTNLEHSLPKHRRRFFYRIWMNRRRFYSLPYRRRFVQNRRPCNFYGQFSSKNRRRK